MRNLSAPPPGGDGGNPENPARNNVVSQWPLLTNKLTAWRRHTLLPVSVMGLWLAALMLIPAKARGVEITPFYTQNQSPMVQIFGLPAAGDAKVLQKGKFSALLAADVASNFAEDATLRENILLDGENYRYTLSLRYGITDRFEGGIDIPYVGQGGGFLDNFIIGWHNFFGLPQNGRKEAPHNRLLYTYTKDGQNQLLINDSAFDIGDIRLYGGMQLYNDGRKNPRSDALRAHNSSFIIL